jgi:hypothetical protein
VVSAGAVVVVGAVVLSGVVGAVVAVVDEGVVAVVEDAVVAAVVVVSSGVKSQAVRSIAVQRMRRSARAKMREAFIFRSPFFL